jgi:hypothetical protein
MGTLAKILREDCTDVFLATVLSGRFDAPNWTISVLSFYSAAN